MGILTWIAAGTAAYFVARIVPLARRNAWAGELVAAIIAAVTLGVVATALDFGGWREPDWRAAAFAACGSFAAVGVVRAIHAQPQ